MASQGRKNVHGKAGVRFKAGWTASKEWSMIRNHVSELIVHGEIRVPSGVVKELVSETEHCITLAKKGDLASRREAAKIVRESICKDGVSCLKVLFDELGPRYKDRQGGYTQTFKLGARRGDNAEIVLVRFVD